MSYLQCWRTGETGPALAEGGDQVSHYHVNDGGDGVADKDRDEDRRLKI